MIALRKLFGMCGVLSVFPFAGSALTPLLPPALCNVDPSTGGLYALGSSQGQPLYYYDLVPGSDVISYSYDTPQGQSVSVLQGCASGHELRVTFPTDGYEASDAYNDMYFSEEAFSFADIARTLRRLGATAQRTRNSFGTCLCDQLLAN